MKQSYLETGKNRMWHQELGGKGKKKKRWRDSPEEDKTEVPDTPRGSASGNTDIWPGEGQWFEGLRGGLFVAVGGGSGT